MILTYFYLFQVIKIIAILWNFACIFQIFEYETTIKDVVDIHYPIRYPEESGNKGEMVCSNKIR